MTTEASPHHLMLLVCRGDNLQILPMQRLINCLFYQHADVYGAIWEVINVLFKAIYFMIYASLAKIQILLILTFPCFFGDIIYDNFSGKGMKLREMGNFFIAF